MSLTFPNNKKNVYLLLMITLLVSIPILLITGCDSIGNGYFGETNYNGTIVEQERYLRFDGEASWVEIEDPVQVPEEIEGLSITYRMKVIDYQDIRNQYCFHLHSTDRGSNVGDSIIWAGLRFNTIIINFGATTGELDAGNTNIKPELNRWYHLAGTWNGEEVKIYIDGEMVYSYNLDLIEPSNSSIFIGGHSRDDGYRVINALISDVSYWHKNLEEEEINMIMSEGLDGSEPGLTGYWPMNEEVGMTINDMSGNNKEGKIRGATWQEVHMD